MLSKHHYLKIAKLTIKKYKSKHIIIKFRFLHSKIQT
jgi:hypothetical protein